MKVSYTGPGSAAPFMAHHPEWKSDRRQQEEELLRHDDQPRRG
jgi:hypothetical protein